MKLLVLCYIQFITFVLTTNDKKIYTDIEIVTARSSFKSKNDNGYEVMLRFASYDIQTEPTFAALSHRIIWNSFLPKPFAYNISQILADQTEQEELQVELVGRDNQKIAVIKKTHPSEAVWKVEKIHKPKDNETITQNDNSIIISLIVNDKSLSHSIRYVNEMQEAELVIEDIRKELQDALKDVIVIEHKYVPIFLPSDSKNTNGFARFVIQLYTDVLETQCNWNVPSHKNIKSDTRIDFFRENQLEAVYELLKSKINNDVSEKNTQQDINRLFNIKNVLINLKTNWNNLKAYDRTIKQIIEQRSKPIQQPIQLQNYNPDNFTELVNKTQSLLTMYNRIFNDRISRLISETLNIKTMPDNYISHFFNDLKYIYRLNGYVHYFIELYSSLKQEQSELKWFFVSQPLKDLIGQEMEKLILEEIDIYQKQVEQIDKPQSNLQTKHDLFKQALDELKTYNVKYGEVLAFKKVIESDTDSKFIPEGELDTKSTFEVHEKETQTPPSDLNPDKKKVDTPVEKGTENQNYEKKEEPKNNRRNTYWYFGICALVVGSIPTGIIIYLRSLKS